MRTNYEDYQETMRGEAHKAYSPTNDQDRQAREDAHDATFMEGPCDDDDEERFDE